MSQFIGTSMKRGHAGELTRGYFDNTVESRLNDGSVKAFGVPVVVKGDKVQLVGFGSFETKQREARTGRNPKTKETIDIPATRVPVFKAGKALKDAVAE